MRNIIFVLICFLAFSVIAKENDNFNYIGSYTSERYSGEHYNLNELWLWEKEDEIIGLLFIYTGLGGEGHVTPMIVKIDNSVGSQKKDFKFNASSFSFVGYFNSNSISGNLSNGGENWNGGKDKIVFTKGTSIQTIANPGDSLKTYKQWLEWVNTLVQVH